MITEYVDSLLWRRRVTLTTSCWRGGGGLHIPHCSGVKSIGCPHKFHHIVEQNVIGSARTARLCLVVPTPRIQPRQQFSIAKHYAVLCYLIPWGFPSPAPPPLLHNLLGHVTNRNSQS